MWGDVRIDFFLHKKQTTTCLDLKNKRSLFFFCVFNTAFYGGKEEVYNQYLPSCAKQQR